MTAADIDVPARGSADGIEVTDEDHEGPPSWVRIVLVAIAVMPIVTAVIRALRRDWFPIGDNALLYIRAADVFTAHHPLLGSWTSASLAVGENMNNPGSLYDLLMSPFARTLSPGPGAAIGVGVLNAASIIGIAVASRHIGGWRMQRWMLLAATCLAWSMGSEMLFDMWQAHALLLPFLAFLVLIVGCASSRPACIPWAMFVGSVLIQTHISYAYILSVLIATAFGVSWWTHRPVHRASVVRALRSRTAGITAAVFVLAWIQPVYEQLFATGRGNLTRLATNSGGGDVTLGLRNATKATSSIVALPWWWMRSGYATAVPNTPLTQTPDGPVFVLAGQPRLALAVLSLAVVIAVLGVLAVMCFRDGRVTAAVAGTLCTVAVPAAVVSLSQLTIGVVGLSAHHVRWVWSLSVFVTFVIIWMASELIALRTSGSSVRSITWLDGVVMAAITVLSVLNVPFFAQPQGPVVDAGTMPAMRRVFPGIEILADHDPVLYDTAVRVFEPYSATMMMRMQQLGIEFRVADEGMVRQLGPERRADGTETTTVFQLEGLAARDYGGPACTIAVVSALPPAEDAAAAELADRLADDLVDGTIAVDDSRLDDSDPIDQLAAARSGDVHAAWLLVIDGTLDRWTDSGIATSTVPGDLGADVDRAMTWTNTAFGLFAEGPWDCPD